MANVQLPNINITNGDISNASLPQLQQIVKSLLNSTIQLTEELTYLLNNLDTRNVNELNAEVIVAGSITADKISAKTITAEKMNVNELSAITANLGHIKAGLIETVQMFGSYIATSQDSYPRCELNPESNLFGAYFDEYNSATIVSNTSNNSPALVFISGGVLAGYLDTSFGYGLTSTGNAAINAVQGRVEVNARSIFLNPDISISIPSWRQLYSQGDGEDLDEALDNLAYNMTFDSSTRNLKLWSRGGDLLAQVNIPGSQTTQSTTS